MPYIASQPPDTNLDACRPAPGSPRCRVNVSPGANVAQPPAGVPSCVTLQIIWRRILHAIWRKPAGGAGWNALRKRKSPAPRETGQGRGRGPTYMPSRDPLENGRAYADFTTRRLRAASRIMPARTFIAFAFATRASRYGMSCFSAIRRLVLLANTVRVARPAFSLSSCWL